MNETPPPILGTGGLLRRPVGQPAQELPVDEEGNPYIPEPVTVTVMPANCRRVLSSPLQPGMGGGCTPGCVGIQPDGGCLCDIVRRANDQGVECSFEVRWDGNGNQFWSYNGPVLAPETPQ